MMDIFIRFKIVILKTKVMPSYCPNSTNEKHPTEFMNYVICFVFIFCLGPLVFP